MGKIVNPFTQKVEYDKRDWSTNRLARYIETDGEIVDQLTGKPVKDHLQKLNESNDSAVEIMREYQQVMYTVNRWLSGADRCREEFEAFELRRKKVVEAYEQNVI